MGHYDEQMDEWDAREAADKRKTKIISDNLSRPKRVELLNEFIKDLDALERKYPTRLKASEEFLGLRRRAFASLYLISQEPTEVPN